MERVMEILRLNAREEAGRQALGLVGRAENACFIEAFDNFKMAFEFLKKEFEAAIEEVNFAAIAQFLSESGYSDITPLDIKEALSTIGVADPQSSGTKR